MDRVRTHVWNGYYHYTAFEFPPVPKVEQTIITEEESKSCDTVETVTQSRPGKK